VRLARSLGAALVLAGLAAPSPAADTEPLPELIGSPSTVLAAGDIASCGKTGDGETAALLGSLPGTILALGDLAYRDGTPTDYARCFQPTWGLYKARIRPTPGNHDYHQAGAPGYFGYFAGISAYYKFELPSASGATKWSFYSLNDYVPADAGSAQADWLEAQLAADKNLCKVIYHHEPFITSSSKHHDSDRARTLVEIAYDHRVSIALAGHNHQYERFAPQNPSGQRDDVRGIREFVAGTGGAGLYGFDTAEPNSEVRGSTYGVLKLTLHATSYDWRFQPIAGQTFTDSGTTACH
jgi:acid phosphatase type 7